MEYYIYNVPVFITVPLDGEIDIPTFCDDIEKVLPARLIKNVDAVYIGEFKELQDRNALYNDGAIYMSSLEPTTFDMVENFVHETAHSLETQYGWDIYTEDLEREFLGKRQRLYHLLSGEGYQISPRFYAYTEYNKKFDEFLANEVGYPTLLNLTMGLFVSPYGATSLPEYFANGFEKYFLDSPRAVKEISPVLYKKIEKIINDKA